jgi:pimeloyl-ACP methyl ester carboxylesterase
MRGSVPRLRDPVVLAGCGHWAQQERPAEVSRAIIDFARAPG